MANQEGRTLFPVKLMQVSEGEAVGYDGGVLSVRCASALPPGAPVVFLAALNADHDGGWVELEGRSLGSSRQDDGFLVRLRLINLRKEQRQAIEALACVSG